MPKYEIGYILSSAVSDDKISEVSEEIAQSITASKAEILKTDDWGRKKLAYPIGRTRYGYYVFLTVDSAPENIIEIERRLRTNDVIIRFLIVNMEDAEKRIAKDQAKRTRRQAASKKAENEKIEEPSESESLEEKSTEGITEDIDEKIDQAIESEEENI